MFKLIKNIYIFKSFYVYLVLVFYNNVSAMIALICIAE